MLVRCWRSLLKAPQYGTHAPSFVLRARPRTLCSRHPTLAPRAVQQNFLETLKRQCAQAPPVMGCVESSQPKKPPKGSAPVQGGGNNTGKRLLEEYSIGSTLGEGAFGVVSNCTNRSTGEQFAVKMVDKVETPVDAIKKEAETLQRLNHPNIVKVHGVFFERCFVCIVMDKYSGGDLVEGLQSHLKERGQINCHHVSHVAQQMGASIHYLHSENIIHRDVKGDNYLMSRKDIIDPKNCIVLTDFGTAVEIKPSERLSGGVGTKIFWSPEFFDKDYGPKVDVWAMGVIMYGLVTGRFPFKDERDIRGKEVRIPKRVHPSCEEFIRKMLEKVENKRLSSEEVMAHPWVAKKAAGDTPAGGSPQEDSTDGRELREELVNDGIKERRQELISRLNQENVARAQPSIVQPRRFHHLQPTFLLRDKGATGAKFAYEWWDSTRVTQAGLLDLEKHARPLEDTLDLDTLRHMLLEHRINPGLFGSGEAKTLPQLAGEVRSGACRLMLDATDYKKLVRVVDVVVLQISAGGSGPGPQRLLIETEECYADGRKRMTLRLPGTKKEPYENAPQCAMRVLDEVMHVPADAIALDLDSIVRYEEETESPSYPGVRTVYRKEIVKGELKTEDAAFLSRVGLPGYDVWYTKDKDGNTKTLAWMTEQMAEDKGVKLKAEGAEVVSTLVRAPIGLNEEQLTKQLVDMGLDVSKYGQEGKTISLRDLSAQLIRGEATLLRGADGQALRVVDVVVLIIKKPNTGEVLVQTYHEQQDGNRTPLNRLPGNKCRPDENHFLSARRILRKQLEIHDNDVTLSQDVNFVEEEAASLERRQWDLSYYGGLKTVYRKRLIKAELVPGAGET